MNILITGINGFVGTHLTALLLSKGHGVYGIDRRNNHTERLALSLKNMGYTQSTEGITIFKNDLGDISSITNIFQNHRIDAVVHLAGTAFVPEGWKDPAGIIKSNTLTTVNLLTGARDAGWKGRFLFVSSSDVYGKCELPIRETTPAIPDSPYAASKLAAEQFSLFFQKDGMDIIIARPFNHIGPGQKESFAVPAFIKRIEEALASNQSSITVGDIHSARDFTDVRDVVSAYLLLLEKGSSGEVYNICSGQMIAIIEILKEILNIKKSNLSIQEDASLKRPEGVTMRYGANDKLRALGWVPRYSLLDTLKELVK